MTTTLKRISTSTALTLSAGFAAEVLGYRAFHQLVRQDVEALLGGVKVAEPTIVTAEMLDGLPVPVRRYLTYSGVMGKPIPRTVHLRQAGRMQLNPALPWVRLAAEEHYSIDPPGFVWDGTAYLGPIPIARARDRYLGGHGGMLVKVASLVSVADATGPEIDQAAMMRYLNEMMWFPAAFLGANISFEAVDESSARVTLADRDQTATATMFFDEVGRLTDFVAPRYRLIDGQAELALWSTPVTSYRDFEGLRLPSAGKVLYKLEDGDLEYIEVTVTELRYDTHLPAEPSGAATEVKTA